MASITRSHRSQSFVAIEMLWTWRRILCAAASTCRLRAAPLVVFEARLAEVEEVIHTTTDTDTVVIGGYFGFVGGSWMGDGGRGGPMILSPTRELQR